MIDVSSVPEQFFFNDSVTFVAILSTLKGIDANLLPTKLGLFISGLVGRIS